jgi:hypothetical protein
MKPQESKTDRQSKDLNAPLKKDGAGSHNWGNPAAPENSIEHHEPNASHINVVNKEDFETLKSQ